MNKKLYKLMNWPLIEEITYSESDRPHEILGPHQVETNTLVQAYFPGAGRVSLIVPEFDYEEEMELADEDGFFAALVPNYGDFKYHFIVKDNLGNSKKVYDPYSFESLFTEKDIERFKKGIHYSLYNFLGAHTCTLNDIKGTSFAVWAPNAIRVSVVGDFNNWDGRVNQMRRLGDSGIFDIFIPGVEEGDSYKYEIKVKNLTTYLKTDPFAFATSKLPDTSSLVSHNEFNWTDEEWIKKRSETDYTQTPISVYELNLNTYFETDDNVPKLSDVSKKVISEIKNLGFTHVEILPLMECYDRDSLGYKTNSYYAPSSRFGSLDEVAAFIDDFHRAEIGVILDWAPHHFPTDEYGLADFDGTKLYENPDVNRRYHPDWGTLQYNYRSLQVSNFLITNALFWVERFHADGLRLDNLASMLYLDYGKENMAWTPNMYGGNEDLDAIEFVKHLNSIIHKRNPGILMIAEANTAFPRITESLDEYGLGFDFKWNDGCLDDYMSYIKLDPYFRAHNHDLLTLSMIYAYSERFILPLSHEEFPEGVKSFFYSLSGSKEEKLANVRLSLSYLFTHPGRKMVYMGSEHDYDNQIKESIKTLNNLYVNEPALSRLDEYSDGFEWINCMSSQNSCISFLRKTDRVEDTLLVVANFSGIEQKLQVGVPMKGTYKEIFTSEDAKYGGSKNGVRRTKSSIDGEWDGRPYSIKTEIPALSLTIYKYLGE